MVTYNYVVVSFLRSPELKFKVISIFALYNESIICNCFGEKIAEELKLISLLLCSTIRRIMHYCHNCFSPYRSVDRPSEFGDFTVNFHTVYELA